MRTHIRKTGWIAGMFAATLMAACGGGEYGASKEDEIAPAGPNRNPNSVGNDSVFGDGGLSVSNLRNGRIFGSTDAQGGSLPVNRFLWQASLETLDFMPLASTDPYTGVIATDWSSPPTTPNERVKVTVYIVNPDLSASALKVAVFREVRDEANGWVPGAVNPATATQIEDAILTKARQIKIADLEDSQTG